MDTDAMAYRGGHILCFIVRLLVCTIMCVAVHIGLHRCASAENIAKVGMPLDVESIDEKCGSINIQSRSRTIDNFIYLILRKSYERENMPEITRSRVDDLLPQSVWFEYGIEFRLRRWKGPELQVASYGNVVGGGTPRISDQNNNESMLTGDQFRGGVV